MHKRSDGRHDWEHLWRKEPASDIVKAALVHAWAAQMRSFCNGQIALLTALQLLPQIAGEEALFVAMRASKMSSNAALRGLARVTTLCLVVVIVSLAGFDTGGAWAQVQTEMPAPVPGAGHAVIERIKVHSPAIEGNLEGNSADRDVLVVLPPSYRGSPSRRYPVVYALHGY